MKNNDGSQPTRISADLLARLEALANGDQEALLAALPGAGAALRSGRLSRAAMLRLALLSGLDRLEALANPETLQRPPRRRRSPAPAPDVLESERLANLLNDVKGGW